MHDFIITVGLLVLALSILTVVAAAVGLLNWLDSLLYAMLGRDRFKRFEKRAEHAREAGRDQLDVRKAQFKAQGEMYRRK